MKIVVLTPSKGTVSIEYRSMVMKLAILLYKAGHKLAFADDTTSGLLHHSRNLLLGELAIQSDDARGLWLDADVHFDPARVLWALERPESEGVITWAYPIRLGYDVDYPPAKFRKIARQVREQPFRLWAGHPVMGPYGLIARSDDGALVELSHAGFGSVLMHSNIAREMHNACGPHQVEWGNRPMSSAFDHLPYPYPRSSEDVSFWRRFSARGHRIWCDPVPYVTNGHSGGCLADEIKKREEQIPWLCCQTGI